MEQGIAQNQNGGYYQRGKSYGIETKLRVAATYLDGAEQSPHARPNISQIARDCNVGWHFVEKIEGELLMEERGILTYDEIDAFVLYRLYKKLPTRSLKSYVNWLFYYTGTIVSASTVSRFFNYGFFIRGGFCQPNLVPYDTFCPANIEKAKDYLRALAKIDPRQIRYGDAKSLKGKSIFYIQV